MAPGWREHLELVVLVRLLRVGEAALVRLEGRLHLVLRALERLLVGRERHAGAIDVTVRLAVIHV